MVEVDSLLRVSAAALCRVIFPHPQTGEMLLALERRINLANHPVRVQAQPFGGALRILDPVGFREAMGDFAYDSVRSSEEQDLRILIPPAAWEATRGFILAQMQSNQPAVIETDPCRELEEEFLETVGITLLPDHYTYQPIGNSIQDRPTLTTNPRMPGTATVRIYRIYEVVLQDRAICEAVLERSKHFTNEDMRVFAETDRASGGKGRANNVVVLPLDDVRDACHRASKSSSLKPLSFGGSLFLEPTTAALFADGHSRM